MKTSFIATTLWLYSQSLFATIAPATETALKNHFERQFAIASLLSSGESITLGFANFSSDKLTGSSSPDDIDELNLRNSLSSGSVSYTFTFDYDNKDYYDNLKFAGSMITTTYNYDNGGGAVGMAENNKDSFYSLYSAYSRFWTLSDHWQSETGFGSLISYYENKHSYGPSMPQEQSDLLDGVIFNLHSVFMTAKPYITFVYKKSESWGKWHFKSKYEYSYGREITGSSDSTSDVNPKYWQVSNTIKLYPMLYAAKWHAESAYFKLQRIDVSGDVVEALDTRSYYEIGTGILLDTRKFTSLSDNIGIGININIGSNLTGGSLVIYYNE
jgi:hypothetical protein